MRRELDRLIHHVYDAWSEHNEKIGQFVPLRSFLIDCLWSTDGLHHQLGVTYQAVEANRFFYMLCLHLWHLRMGGESVPLPEIQSLKPKVKCALQEARCRLATELAKQPKDWSLDNVKWGSQGAPTPIYKTRKTTYKTKCEPVVQVVGRRKAIVGARVALCSPEVQVVPCVRVQAEGLRPPEMRKTETVEGKFVSMPAGGGFDWSKPSKKSTATR